MKKRTIGKLLAFTMATTMVFGNPMNAFACDDMYGTCDGLCQFEWSGMGDGEMYIIGSDSDNTDSDNTDSGNSDEEPCIDLICPDVYPKDEAGQDSYLHELQSEEVIPLDNPSEDMPKSDGESSDAPSYESSHSAPEASYDSYDDQSSFDAGSSSADVPYVAPESDPATDTAGTKGYKRDGARLTVDNFETAWHLVRSANGTYNVKHKGQDAYTAQLMDASGNAVSFKGAGMYRTEDGRLFINIITADGVDTTGYTLCTWKGTASYLPKLGISGVCLNNTVMVDADAIQ